MKFMSLWAGDSHPEVVVRNYFTILKLICVVFRYFGDNLASREVVD
jgi:hypothetical protein